MQTIQTRAYINIWTISDWRPGEGSRGMTVGSSYAHLQSFSSHTSHLAEQLRTCLPLLKCSLRPTVCHLPQWTPHQMKYMRQIATTTTTTTPSRLWLTKFPRKSSRSNSFPPRGTPLTESEMTNKVSSQSRDRDRPASQLFAINNILHQGHQCFGFTISGYPSTCWFPRHAHTVPCVDWKAVVCGGDRLRSNFRWEIKVEG